MFWEIARLIYDKVILMDDLRPCRDFEIDKYRHHDDSDPPPRVCRHGERRHDQAALRTMLVCEGLCYAAGGCLWGLILAAFDLTLVKGMVDSMWQFTFHFTIVPALAACGGLLMVSDIVPVREGGKAAGAGGQAGQPAPLSLRRPAAGSHRPGAGDQVRDHSG